jgi:hypothetical protein
VPSRIRRRTLLAGLAAVPAAGLLGCDRRGRTTAAPIKPVGTLTFANRLRIPSPTGGVLRTGIRTVTLTAAAGSAEFLPRLSTRPWPTPTDGFHRRCLLHRRTTSAVLLELDVLPTGDRNPARRRRHPGSATSGLGDDLPPN